MDMKNNYTPTQTDGQESLSEYLRQQRKHTRLLVAIGIALLAALVGITVIALPRAVTVLDHLEESLQEIDALVAHADRMVSENTGAVGEALNKINGVDFDTLNQAIRDLSDTVKPLANFARMFKGG